MWHLIFLGLVASAGAQVSPALLGSSELPNGELGAAPNMVRISGTDKVLFSTISSGDAWIYEISGTPPLSFLLQGRDESNFYWTFTEAQGVYIGGKDEYRVIWTRDPVTGNLTDTGITTTLLDEYGVQVTWEGSWVSGENFFIQMAQFDPATGWDTVSTISTLQSFGGGGTWDYCVDSTLYWACASDTDTLEDDEAFIVWGPKDRDLLLAMGTPPNQLRATVPGDSWIVKGIVADESGVYVHGQTPNADQKYWIAYYPWPPTDGNTANVFVQPSPTAIEEFSGVYETATLYTGPEGTVWYVGNVAGCYRLTSVPVADLRTGDTSRLVTEGDATMTGIFGGGQVGAGDYYYVNLADNVFVWEFPGEGTCDPPCSRDAVCDAFSRCRCPSGTFEQPCGRLPDINSTSSFGSISNALGVGFVATAAVWSAGGLGLAGV